MSVKTTNRAQEVPATEPLGARHDGRGATFALFSSVADGVELCLFDDSGAETRWSLDQGDGFVWQGYLPDVAPGQRYGFRVHGPWDPPAGVRCNPAKLLIDPYASLCLACALRSVFSASASIVSPISWRVALISSRIVSRIGCVSAYCRSAGCRPACARLFAHSTSSFTLSVICWDTGVGTCILDLPCSGRRPAITPSTTAMISADSHAVTAVARHGGSQPQHSTVAATSAPSA